MNLSAAYWHEVGAAFDKLAMRYDELWTHSPVGRLERDEVWRCIKRLFRPGDRLLDLGCGTGEDAVHLERLGVTVSASMPHLQWSVLHAPAASTRRYWELKTSPASTNILMELFRISEPSIVWRILPLFARRLPG